MTFVGGTSLSGSVGVGTPTADGRFPNAIFAEARRNAKTVTPGPTAHPAARLGWLVEQPDALTRGRVGEIGDCLEALDPMGRAVLAAACEAKFFPKASSRYGMTVEQQTMLRMLQSVRGGG